MQIMKAADHRRMPWKNGKGETAEIALFPEDAGLEDFGWRLSMASVSEPGAFSIFPGIDRVLAIVQGEGLRLLVEGREAIVTPEREAAAFAGDVDVTSDLLGGPVVDLNLMTRRGRFHGSMERVGGQERREIAGKGAATLVVLRAPCAVSSRDGSVPLARLDVVRVEDGEVLSFQPALAALDLLVVRIVENGEEAGKVLQSFTNS
ncbi:HutD family protein [Breoghania sp.]|uniref:HutD/Ves family protein n=1 Tax=Breoghania sp. TaxID=2065378 RepID=UPI002AAB60FD|nr:HutD family protein [Breoghania sp.]